MQPCGVHVIQGELSCDVHVIRDEPSCDGHVMLGVPPCDVRVIQGVQSCDDRVISDDNHVRVVGSDVSGRSEIGAAGDHVRGASGDVVEMGGNALSSTARTGLQPPYVEQHESQTGHPQSPECVRC